MPAADDFTAHVAARAADFFHNKTHWQRRLWNVGLVMRLREVLEASDAVRNRALSLEALSWFSERVRRHIPMDPGAGGPKQRDAIMRQFASDLSVGGLPYLALQEYLEEVEAKYMARWADAVREEAARPSEERTSRALAARLLDEGFGSEHLSSWLSDIDKGGEFTAADLFDAASSLLVSPKRTFETLVLFTVEPSRRATRPSEWISSSQAAEWLRTKGFSDVKLRQRGGLAFTVEALDLESALSEVANRIDRFSARVSVGTLTQFELYSDVFVAGFGAFSHQRANRHVKVHALARADRVYDLAGESPIDSAFELLSHLNNGPPSVAVAAGWSAIEALMTGPGDRQNVAAADRLAALVACSWVRAELTDLAWAKVSQADDGLASELQNLPTNRERASRMAEALIAGPISLHHAGDVTAVKRMEAALLDSHGVLSDVRNHAIDAFRRLYRVRNVVLHGAKVESVALDATLRTVPPLVGAGMDRVAHAYLVSGRQPLELAARAVIELQRAGSDDARAIVDMLE